jgi:hypothetical protein
LSLRWASVLGVLVASFASAFVDPSQPRQVDCVTRPEANHGSYAKRPDRCAFHARHAYTGKYAIAYKVTGIHWRHLGKANAVGVGNAPGASIPNQRPDQDSTDNPVDGVRTRGVHPRQVHSERLLVGL